MQVQEAHLTCKRIIVVIVARTAILTEQQNWIIYICFNVPFQNVTRLFSLKESLTDQASSVLAGLQAITDFVC